MLNREYIMNLEAGREMGYRTKQCKQCNSLFNKKSKESYKEWDSRVYCSIKCKNVHYNNNKGKDKRKWTIAICEHCSKEFEARKIHRNRGQLKYCSTECSYIAGRKHEVKTFNGVNYYFHEISGYFVSDDGEKMHRAVWSFYNGKIPEKHVIHHIDEDKTNNNIENLMLMEWGEHTAHHHSTGITMTIISCLGCGETVSRKQSEVKRGQNKYCSKACSNKHRGRNENGTYSRDRVS